LAAAERAKRRRRSLGAVYLVLCPVVLHMKLRRLAGVMFGVFQMPGGGMRVMRRFLVMPCIMILRRLPVVLRCMLVMFRGFAVMFANFLHGSSSCFSPGRFSGAH